MTQSHHLTAKDKGKNLIQEELVEKWQNQSRELLAMNLKLTSAKVEDILAGKLGTTVVGGGERREQCINVDTNLG